MSQQLPVANPATETGTNTSELKKLYEEVRDGDFRRLLLEVIAFVVIHAELADSFVMKLYKSDAADPPFDIAGNQQLQAIRRAYCENITNRDLLVKQLYNTIKPAISQTHQCSGNSPDKKAYADEMMRCVLVAFDVQAAVKTFLFMRFETDGDYFSRARSSSNFLNVYVDLQRKAHRSVNLNSLRESLLNCIAHRNDTSHINDLTDEQISSFKIAYDDMLKLAGVLADTKATNAASNAEKERLQNIRQLADSVIEKINKRKAELQSPCTPEEICNRYKEMFGEELAPEDAVRLFVKEYGNDSLIKANGQRILYIYDMDEAMNAVHCKILGADAAENQKKRNEYLCQLRMYNGGIMPQDTLHSLMDCYTFVLSRDYVMSAQFERLLNGCISSNCQRYNLQLQISSSVLNEVKEKSLFDADSEARARCKMIDKQLERLKKDNRLHVVQINAKNTYSEADEFAELDSNRSMFYCLLTLRPDGFPDADSAKAPNVLFGKFLISGDFMLYRRSLERLHLSERTAGSDFKTTFCDENGNTVTLEHKSSSGGEGTIYTTDLEGKVAKLFNQQTAKKKEKKLKAQIGKPPKIDALCWPEHLLYDGKRFVGYLMPRSVSETLSTVLAMHTNDAFKSDAMSGWTRLELAQICLNIAELEQKLLQMGKTTANGKPEYRVLMGDVSDKNILFDRDTRKVYFVDCDSYTFDQFPCDAKTPTYNTTPPFRTQKPYQQELYAFAQLFFKILMNDREPFVYGSQKERLEKMKNGDFTFTDLEGDTGTAQWYNMPEKLRRLFIKTFKNREPAGIAEWVAELKSYCSGIKSGKYSAEITPTRYLNRDNANIVDIECAFCRKRGDRSATNMLLSKKNQLERQGRLLFCPLHAGDEDSYWRTREKVVSGCVCDECGKTFRTDRYSVMRAYMLYDGRIYCKKCKNREV